MNEFLGSEALYKRVDNLRNAKGWTIYELAKRASITENTIYRWRDKKSSPTLQVLEKLSEAFGIHIVQLIVNEEEIAALSEEQQDLIKRWTTLQDYQKRALLEMIKAFQRDDVK